MLSNDRPFLLFDDVQGGSARLYSRPAEAVEAWRIAEVGQALERLRAGLAAGRHAAGYLAYEAGHAFEPRLRHLPRSADQPLLWFGLFDGYSPVDWAELQRGSAAAGAWVGRPQPTIAQSAYADAAARVREHLMAGDFYQANLTFGCTVRFLGDPVALYSRLRGHAAARWGGIVRRSDGWLLSLSPEQFFTIRGREITARPMKGTALRGRTAEDDSRQALGLAADPKQRAENLMIVDLIRNDVARVAEPGSMSVPELFTVESYPTLHQLTSRVTARLRAGVDAIDVLKALFPCGSVTGAPKISAIERLAAIEWGPRGPYTGSMGWIEPGGDASFNVLIRTLEIGAAHGVARLGVGSALVVASNAGDEWAECLAKGAFVSRATPEFDLIETMRFDPGEGLVELDRHLARLGGAARALEFRFDRHAARNELQAATFGKTRAAVARLMLSPSGAMAVELRPLPEPVEGPVTCALAPLPVDPADFRLRFKTSDRGFYDEARSAAGTFEVLFTDGEGFLTEGSFTSLFVERDGVLLTPPLGRGLLPGVLRAKLIDEGRAAVEDLRPEDLAGGFLIGNMVRGLIPARLV